MGRRGDTESPELSRPPINAAINPAMRSCKSGSSAGAASKVWPQTWKPSRVLLEADGHCEPIAGPLQAAFDQVVDICGAAGRDSPDPR